MFHIQANLNATGSMYLYINKICEAPKQRLLHVQWNGTNRTSSEY